MKIDGTGMSQMIKSYGHQQKKATKSNKSKKQDQVSLSDEALELQKVKQRLDEVKDVRQAKVAKLKSQVQQGTYNVSGEDIAEKMLEQVKIDTLI